MATQKNFMDDEEQENGTQSTSLESAAVGGGAAPAASAQPAKQQGTGWNNLQTYLTANLGQGGTVAGAITQDTQKRVETADSNAKLWEGEAKKRVDQSTRIDDKGYGQQIQSGDPTKIDQNAFGAWKNLSNYWGAKNAQEDTGYGNAYNQTQQAKQEVKGVQDYDTQKSLANKAFNQDGRYTQGMGMLDTFIMRGDESGQKALQSFQDKNKDFGKTFDNAVGSVNSYQQGAGQRGQQAYDNLMNTLGQRQTGIQSELQARAATQNQQDLTNLQGQFDQTVGSFSPAVYAGQAFRPKVKAEDYVSGNKLNGVDVATQVEIEALNSLSGLDDDVSTGGYMKSGARNSLDEAKLQADLQRQYEEWIDSFRGPGSGSGGGTAGNRSKVQ